MVVWGFLRDEGTGSGSASGGSASPSDSWAPPGISGAVSALSGAPVSGNGLSSASTERGAGGSAITVFSCSRLFQSSVLRVMVSSSNMDTSEASRRIALISSG